MTVDVPPRGRFIGAKHVYHHATHYRGCPSSARRRRMVRPWTLVLSTNAGRRPQSSIADLPNSIAEPPQLRTKSRLPLLPTRAATWHRSQPLFDRESTTWKSTVRSAVATWRRSLWALAKAPMLRKYGSKPLGRAETRAREPHTYDRRFTGNLSLKNPSRRDLSGRKTERRIPWILGLARLTTGSPVSLPA
jgi:hypothetical protein